MWGMIDLQALLVLRKIRLENITQILVVVRRYAVIRADTDRAIITELVGLQTVLDLRSIGSLEVILKAPGNFIATHKQRSRLYIETDPWLE